MDFLVILLVFVAGVALGRYAWPRKKPDSPDITIKSGGTGRPPPKPPGGG